MLVEYDAIHLASKEIVALVLCQVVPYAIRVYQDAEYIIRIYEIMSDTLCGRR